MLTLQFTFFSKKTLHFTLATTRIWEIEEGNFGNSLLLNIGGKIQ